MKIDTRQRPCSSGCARLLLDRTPPERQKKSDSPTRCGVEAARPERNAGGRLFGAIQAYGRVLRQSTRGSRDGNGDGAGPSWPSAIGRWATAKLEGGSMSTGAPRVPGNQKDGGSHRPRPARKAARSSDVPGKTAAVRRMAATE